MAKRSARHKARELHYHEPATVHPLFPPERGWSPHDLDQGTRDRKYVKNVRAMSPTQQQLMDAINERSVVVAEGTCGAPGAGGGDFNESMAWPLSEGIGC